MASGDYTESVGTILIVDDNVRLRKKIAAAVKEDGHTAVPVGSGESAMVTLEALRPDLIICDLHLRSAIDGLEVLEIIRKNPEMGRTPVILISSLGDQSLGHSSGADFFLKKPFKIRALMATVKYLLHPLTLGRKKHG